MSNPVKNSVIQVLNGILTAGLNFFIMLVYARWLGPQGYGSFSTSQAQVLSWISLVDLGLTSGLIAALHQTETQNLNPRHLLYQVLKIRLAAAGLATLFIGLISWVSFHDYQSLKQDLAFCPHLFAYGIHYSLSSYWIYRGKLPFTVFANLAGVISANSFALYVASRQGSVPELLLAQSWGGLVAAGLLTIALWNEPSSDFQKHNLKSGFATLKLLWVDTWPSALVMSAMALWGRIDQIAASRWLGLESGGQYSLALRFVAVPILLFSSIQYALFSDLQRKGRSDPKSIYLYVRALTKSLVRFGLPFCFGILMMAKVVVPTVLPQYQKAASLLPSFTFAVWGYAIASVLSGALMGLRRYDMILKAYSGSLSFFVFGIFLLTPLFQLSGLVFAYSIFPIALSVICYLYLKDEGAFQGTNILFERFLADERKFFQTAREKIGL